MAESRIFVDNLQQLENEKNALSDLVDERNVEILKGQDSVDALEQKLQSMKQEMKQGMYSKPPYEIIKSLENVLGSCS